MAHHTSRHKGGKQLNPELIYNYLTQKHKVPHVHAIGILANLRSESAFKPSIYGDFVIADPSGNMGFYERYVNRSGDGWVYNDRHPTKAGQKVESSLVDGITASSGGLFQHHDTRFKNLVKFIESKGGDWKTDWKLQIDFAMQERQMKKYLATKINSGIYGKDSAKDYKEATRQFLRLFERPGDDFKSQDKQKFSPNYSEDQYAYYTKGSNRFKKFDYDKNWTNLNTHWSVFGEGTGTGGGPDEERKYYRTKTNETVTREEGKIWSVEELQNKGIRLQRRWPELLVKTDKDDAWYQKDFGPIDVAQQYRLRDEVGIFTDQGKVFYIEKDNIKELESLKNFLKESNVKIFRVQGYNMDNEIAKQLIPIEHWATNQIEISNYHPDTQQMNMVNFYSGSMGEKYKKYSPYNINIKSGSTDINQDPTDYNTKNSSWINSKQTETETVKEEIDFYTYEYEKLMKELDNAHPDDIPEIKTKLKNLANLKNQQEKKDVAYEEGDEFLDPNLTYPEPGYLEYEHREEVSGSGLDENIPSDVKGDWYLDRGYYVSDDYVNQGGEPDENGYTGRARKVPKFGKVFDPKDPNTFVWQYERIGQVRSDGSIVEGSEGFTTWEEVDYRAGKGFSGLIDENAMYVHKKDDNSPSENTREEKKQSQSLYKALTALKAGAGLISLSKAMKEIPVEEMPELSNHWYDYVGRLKQLSEQGFSAEEEVKHKKDLTDAYSGAVRNVFRKSGGSVSTALAGLGILNSNMVDGLINLAAKDQEIKKQRSEELGRALANQEQMLGHRGEVNARLKYAEQKRLAEGQGSIADTLLASAQNDIEYAKLTGPGSMHSALIEHYKGISQAHKNIEDTWLKNILNRGENGEESLPDSVVTGQQKEWFHDGTLGPNGEYISKEKKIEIEENEKKLEEKEEEAIIELNTLRQQIEGWNAEETDKKFLEAQANGDFETMTLINRYSPFMGWKNENDDFFTYSDNQNMYEQETVAFPFSDTPYYTDKGYVDYKYKDEDLVHSQSNLKTLWNRFSGEDTPDTWSLTGRNYTNINPNLVPEDDPWWNQEVAMDKEWWLDPTSPGIIPVSGGAATPTNLWNTMAFMAGKNEWMKGGQTVNPTQNPFRVKNLPAPNASTGLLSKISKGMRGGGWGTLFGTALIGHAVAQNTGKDVISYKEAFDKKLGPWSPYTVDPDNIRHDPNVILF